MILSALLVASIVAALAFALATIILGPILRFERALVAAGLFGVFAGVGWLLGAAGRALVLPLVSDAHPINLPLTALPTALILGTVATWAFLSRQARQSPSAAV